MFQSGIFGEGLQNKVNDAKLCKQLFLVLSGVNVYLYCNSSKKEEVFTFKNRRRYSRERATEKFFLKWGP